MALGKQAQREIVNDYLRALTTYWPSNYMDVTKQHIDITLDQLQSFMRKHGFVIGEEYGRHGRVLRKRYKLDEHQLMDWIDKYFPAEIVE